MDPNMLGAYGPWAAAIVGDGKTLVSGASKDTAVRLWDVPGAG